MNRKSAAPLFFLFGLFLSACGGDRTDSGLITPRTPGAGTVETQDFDPDDLDYEEITGTLAPGMGGVMGDYLVQWKSRNCWFGLVVPEGAVPDGSPIQFVMRIPTRASYMAYPELSQHIFIRLEPGYVNFGVPITVVATWMPWEGVPPTPLIYSSGSESGTAEVTYVPSINRYRVEFDVDHFSDWELGPGPMKGEVIEY